MLQAAVSDCLFFDFFPFSQNGFVSSEVDVGRCDVVEALKGGRCGLSSFDEEPQETDQREEIHHPFTSSQVQR